jgi:hypothetical protein
MSLHHSQSPKINPTEQTPQSGLHHHENSHLAESAYITSEYQKTTQTPTTRETGYETNTKIDSSSPYRQADSSRFSTDDKYSAYSTTGLGSTLGSAALNYQYTSKDYTLPSTYGATTSYSYQPSAKIEEYSKSLENPEPTTQSYNYSSYKMETTSPTIKALNENTASLLGRSAAIENNFGKTSLTLQERYGLTPALSFGANNYSTDLTNLGVGKEEHKASDNLKYSDYLKSKHTVQSFEYGKSPYEQTFGSTAGLAGEDTKKSGLQQQSKGLYSSTDYTDLINKISSKAEPKNDAYTVLKPDSLTNTEKKQRQTVGSHYYQSTYPNTVRTPSESGRKERDRYANSELSAAASPPFKRDRLEVSHQQEVVDDYVISDPHITKKTLYTIENSGSISINGGKDFVNQISGLHKTPDRKIKTKSGSPSPLDDLKHALKNDSVQISKIVIETVENYGGETEVHAHSHSHAHETSHHHHRHTNEKFDIVTEHRGHSRTGSIKSPVNNIKIQRNLIEDSSSFKAPVHHRQPSDTSSSKVGGTITAINDRIKDLDQYLNQGAGVRSSATKYQSLLSSNSKAETAGVHHRAPQHHHHEEKSVQEKQKEDEKLKAKIEKEKEKEREKQEKEREKQEKERQKQEKERQKKEQEEAKAKAKQAAAAAKESNKHHNHNNGHFIVKFIIAFIVLLLLGVLSLELILGADEYDALLDTPLNQVLRN